MLDKSKARRALYVIRSYIQRDMSAPLHEREAAAILRVALPDRLADAVASYVAETESLFDRKQADAEGRAR